MTPFFTYLMGVKTNFKIHFHCSLSPAPMCRFNAFLFKDSGHKRESQVICMRKKTLPLALENDFPVDLTLHQVPASLLTDFAEKIVKPYFRGNLNAAIQDLLQKALTEQDFVLSHITHVRNYVEA